MLILGLDVETTGLDVNTCEVIEVGAVLWDTDRQTPVVILSEMVQLAEGQIIPEEVIKITGITDDDLHQFGKPLKEVMTSLLPLMEKADYMMAHNAPFDRDFIHKSLNQCFASDDKSDNKIKTVLEKKWIDTLTDIIYSDRITSRKLNHLACEHQFLNYYSHRAVFDTLTMLKIASNYDINEIIKLNSSPSLTLKAEVSFKEKDKAKARGYFWDNKNRIWYKQIKELQFEEERQKCDFELTII